MINYRYVIVVGFILMLSTIWVHFLHSIEPVSSPTAVVPQLPSPHRGDSALFTQTPMPSSELSTLPSPPLDPPISLSNPAAPVQNRTSPVLRRESTAHSARGTGAQGNAPPSPEWDAPSIDSFGERANENVDVTPIGLISVLGRKILNAQSYSDLNEASMLCSTFYKKFKDFEDRANSELDSKGILTWRYMVRSIDILFLAIEAKRDEIDTGISGHGAVAAGHVKGSKYWASQVRGTLTISSNFLD